MWNWLSSVLVWSYFCRFSLGLGDKGLGSAQGSLGLTEVRFRSLGWGTIMMQGLKFSQPACDDPASSLSGIA